MQQRQGRTKARRFPVERRGRKVASWKKARSAGTRRSTRFGAIYKEEPRSSTQGDRDGENRFKYTKGGEERIVVTRESRRDSLPEDVRRICYLPLYPEERKALFTCT